MYGQQGHQVNPQLTETQLETGDLGMLAQL